MLQISPVYATVFVASMLFPALSTIFKEQIFTKAKETLKGKQLDIFVVRISSHDNTSQTFSHADNECAHVSVYCS